MLVVAEMVDIKMNERVRMLRPMTVMARGRKRSERLPAMGAKMPNRMKLEAMSKPTVRVLKPRMFSR